MDLRYKQQNPEKWKRKMHGRDCHRGYGKRGGAQEEQILGVDGMEYLILPLS